MCIPLYVQSVDVMCSFKLRVKAGFFASFLLLVTGCATPPQTAELLQRPPEVKPAHQIENVPFYAQKAFFCGPTTLAEIFNFYGRQQSPDDIAPWLFVPEKQGSFQIEMVAAARAHDFLAYQDRGSLRQLIHLLDDNIPVIVFQNLSIDWFPAWHYAVVKGYDLEQQKFYLHSGTIKDHETDFDVFERTWKRGNYWLLVILPPDKTSKQLNSFVFTRSAQDLISTNRTQAGLQALKSATHQWKDYWLPYFLLGNYYLKEDRLEAITWYEKGLEFALDNASYLNNYAYALNKSGQQKKALKWILKAIELDRDNQNIQDTYRQILSTLKP